MKSSLAVLTFIFFISISCGKKSYNSVGNTGNNDTSFKQPVDPPVASTIGFFLNDWIPKSFTVPSYTDTTIKAGNITSFVSIDASNIITKIPQTVFGQNANIWMTPILTENVLMNHLTDLHPGIIRFPGGSLSDMYFWNADAGKNPSDVPDSLLDANGNSSSAGYWYGRNNANWTMSVDNYYSLLQQLGSQGIITVNYSYARYGTSNDPVSAAAHLAADWIRYDNGRTKYWEIGNEDNGTWEASYRINTTKNKDGQPEIITGDLYGKHFKVFADSMKKAASEIGKTIFIGAQLLEKQPESWQTNTDKSWNQGVLAQVNASADFYIVHSYYTPYQQNSTASVIISTAKDNTSAMMDFLTNSFASNGVAPKPIALTEWNITSQGSMQQVSFVSGIHSVLLLGEALKNKYGETSRWDLANGWNNGNDMGLFNIGDEPGISKWNPRPSFYYMYYFNQYIGDRLLNTSITGSGDILAYGSSFSSGEKGVIIINKGTTSQGVSVEFQNFKPGSRFYWYALSGGTDNGEFSGKVFINGQGPSEVSGGPVNYKIIKPYSAQTKNGMVINVSARTVIYMVIDK